MPGGFSRVTLIAVISILAATTGAGAKEVVIERGALGEDAVTTRGIVTILVFRGRGETMPRTAFELKRILQERLPEGVEARRFRSRWTGDFLEGYAAIEGEEEGKLAAAALAEGETLDLLATEEASPMMLEILGEMEQESAPGAGGGTPRVVAAEPSAGERGVPAGTGAIRLTFDEEMAEGWSWTGAEEFFPPLQEGAGPRWIDRKTVELPVRLEAGKFYRVGINEGGRGRFRSAAGRAAAPAAVWFATEGATAETLRKTRRPMIVNMEPASGSGGVPAGLTALTVTFSVPMAEGFGWVVAEEEGWARVEGATWSEDRKTATLPVRLEKGKVWRLNLNAQGAEGFQSAWGVPLDPVSWTFQTE